MRVWPVWILILLLPAAALADKGAVSIICIEPPRPGEAYRAAAMAAQALQQEIASRGRKVVDAATALHRPGKGASARAREARAEVKVAVEDYDTLEFGKASRRLEAALGTMREALAMNPAAITHAEYATAAHYLAAAAFYNGELDAATRHFIDAYAFAPGAAMDDAVFPPDLIKHYQATTAGLAQTGEIAVKSTRPGEAYLNGTPAGVAPTTLTGITPGTHLVRVQAPGYRSSAIWVEVKAGRVSNVTMDLKAGKKLRKFTSAAATVREELAGSRPGPGAAKLAKLVKAASLVLVATAQGGAVQASWADGGVWVKRYQATVAQGQEPMFAKHFFNRGVSVTPRVECSRDTDCLEGRYCTRDGRCEVGKAAAVGKPIYKEWWFWTIIGAAVVGGTVGVVVGTLPADRTATVRQGAWP